jgi:hypothetical protein
MRRVGGVKKPMAQTTVNRRLGPLHARGSEELTSEFLGIKKKTYYGPNDIYRRLGPVHLSPEFAGEKKLNPFKKNTLGS